MAVLKCKMCGGEVELNSEQTVGECLYCGVISTFPKISDEKKINLYNRANHFRMQNEFDKAINAYENIIADDEKNAEAHWCMVLCRYGIEYVEDPKSHERIPTCHRASSKSIFDDYDYKLAIENADTVARDIYEAQAKQIDEINRRIIEISKKQEQYEVFICYKETSELNQRTKDSVLAQKIYDELTDKGIRVFFSRITLENMLGLEYEPCIFAALNSAKVMLAFGSKIEYYNAVWVKNEWSRFISLMKSDKSKSLIPVYFDIDAYDIPDEMSMFQAQDMGKIGSEQDLVRGVMKLLGKDKASAINNTHLVNTSNYNPQESVELGFIELNTGNTKKAEELFKKSLEADISNIGALYGMLMVSDTKSAMLYCEKIISLKNEICDEEKQYLSNRSYVAAEMLVRPLLCFSGCGDSGRVKYIINEFPEGINTYPRVLWISIMDNCKDGIEIIRDAYKKGLKDRPENFRYIAGEQKEYCSTIFSYVMLKYKDGDDLDVLSDLFDLSNAKDKVLSKTDDKTMAELTLIDFAIMQNKSVPLIKHLIDKGINPNGGGLFSTPTLYTALIKGKTGLAQVLIDSGADLNAEFMCFNKKMHNDAFMCPVWFYVFLQFASGVGISKEFFALDEEVLKFLLKNGVDVNTPVKIKSNTYYMLERAVFFNYGLSIIKLIAENVTDINQMFTGNVYMNRKDGSPSQFRATALIHVLLIPSSKENYASYQKDLLEYFISRGANVNQFIYYIDENNKELLYSLLSIPTTFAPNASAAKMLLEAGADPNISFKRLVNGVESEKNILGDYIESNTVNQGMLILLYSYKAKPNQKIKSFTYGECSILARYLHRKKIDIHVLDTMLQNNENINETIQYTLKYTEKTADGKKDIDKTAYFENMPLYFIAICRLNSLDATSVIAQYINPDITTQRQDSELYGTIIYWLAASNKYFLPVEPGLITAKEGKEHAKTILKSVKVDGNKEVTYRKDALFGGLKTKTTTLKNYLKGYPELYKLLN